MAPYQRKAKHAPVSETGISQFLTAWVTPVEWTSLGARMETYCSVEPAIEAFTDVSKSLEVFLPPEIIGMIVTQVRQTTFEEASSVWSEMKGCLRKSCGHNLTDTTSDNYAQHQRQIAYLVARFGGSEDDDVLSRQFSANQDMLYQIFGLRIHFAHDLKSPNVWAYLLHPISKHCDKTLKHHHCRLFPDHATDGVQATERTINQLAKHKHKFPQIMEGLNLKLDERYIDANTIDPTETHAGWGGRPVAWPAIMKFKPQQSIFLDGIM